MHVSPDEIKAKAQTVQDTADDAEGPLAAIRQDAASAKPGFPGDAAGPFDTFVADLEEQDPKLLQSIRATADTMRNGADSYLDQDDAVAEYLT